MFKRELLKNKLFGLLIMFLAVLSIKACGDDATVFICLFPIGLLIFMDRKDVFDESRYEEEDDWEDYYDE